MKYSLLYQSPIGPFFITEANGGIAALTLGAAIPADAEEQATPLLQKAASQLQEYFEGKRKNFDLPLTQEGTEFQQRVWQALCRIPYGETRSYKQLAQMSDSPKGYRAVGMANNKNRIPIIVPCHRVIGANGKLVGYALGLDIKEFLLKLEQQNAS